MKNFIVFISLLLFVLSFGAHAQVDKVGQSGCGFLDVAAGARAAGMGEAFTVLGQEPTALFYNPACMGEVEGKFALSAGGTQWIADIDYLHLTGVFNSGVWGNFGFSVITPDYGEFLGTRFDEDSGWVETAPYHPHAFCAGLAYAREFTDKFTVGLHVKYVSQHLGWNRQEVRINEIDTIVRVENEISTFSYDFGLLFYPGFKSFAFGMSVRNFSPRIQYENLGFELPLTFTLGVAMDILDLFGEYPDYSLNVAADGIHPRDWGEQYKLGVEFGYKDMFFLRAGRKFNVYKEGLTAGIGISYSGVKLDYSYSKHEMYDFINRASVGFAF